MTDAVDAAPVSIVVLNYNYERFLADAVDSALAQSLPGVEVVVVDDGSSDRSRDVIRSYGDRVVAVLKDNGGQGSAMNAGFAAATGEVVLFLDADDLLDPAAAGTVAAAFDADPAAAWVMFRLRMVDGDGAPLGRVRPHRAGVMPDGDLRGHLRRYRCFHWQPTSGNAFARWALERVLPVPEDAYRISADAYLAGVVPLTGPVRSTDAVAGSYRLHGGSHFTDRAVDASWFRVQIERQVVTHRHAAALARSLDVPLPEDAREPRDAAFLAFRLASLRLDPDGHPFPDEGRLRLASRGVPAALGNPELSWPNRLRRAGWFVAAGLAPDALAQRVVARAPDTPAARARRTPRPDAR